MSKLDPISCCDLFDVMCDGDRIMAMHIAPDVAEDKYSAPVTLQFAKKRDEL